MGLRILLVEDDPGDAMLAEAHVRRAHPDAEVVRARTLKAALSRLAENTFDLILLDLGLPDVEGVEAVEAFEERFGEVPVVVLTGRETADPIALEALRRGAQDYVSKDATHGTIGVSIRHAIERHRLRQELRAAKRQVEEQAHAMSLLARRDPLTGIANRRVLEDELALMPARARRTGLAAYGVLFDLDEFKAINTQHGLHGGDEVLRAVASCIADTIRPADVLARIGGDEFAVVFSAERQSGAVVFVERLRQAIDRLRVGEAGVHVTASWAVVGLDRPQSVASFLERARGALDTTKQSGKNCIAVRRSTQNIESRATGAEASLLDPTRYRVETCVVIDRLTREHVARWHRASCATEAGTLDMFDVATLSTELGISDVVGEHSLTALIGDDLRAGPAWYSVLPGSVDSVARLADSLAERGAPMGSVHLDNSLLPSDIDSFAGRLVRARGVDSVVLSTSVVGPRFFECLVVMKPRVVVYRAERSLHDTKHHQQQLTRLHRVCGALGIQVCVEGLAATDPILEATGVRLVVTSA